jgi:hypothetical protein
VRDTARRYPELSALSRIVEKHFVPGLPKANERALRR